jgi:hypothetical protein
MCTEDELWRTSGNEQKIGHSKNTRAQLSTTKANRYDFSAIPEMESMFDVGFYLGRQSGGLSVGGIVTSTVFTAH